MTTATVDWLLDAMVKIDKLSELEEGWDSYGAAPIDPSSIAYARTVAIQLLLAGADKPAVSGTPDGHVGFSWDDGTHSLDAEVLPDGKIAYVYLGPLGDVEAATFRTADLLRYLKP